MRIGEGLGQVLEDEMNFKGLLNEKSDSWRWKRDSIGTYIVSSTYKVLMNLRNEVLIEGLRPERFGTKWSR